MQLRTWFGVATATTTLCGFLVWGCSSDNNNNKGDASVDSGVSDAPCPIDVNLLVPVDAATNPVAAACQACILGLTGCLTAFQNCNANCLCTEAVVQVTGCIADGGNAAVCGASVLADPAFAAADPILNQLFACQANPACASACNPTLDAGAVGDASDAGTAPTDASADGG
jgi:hypothetical protein